MACRDFLLQIVDIDEHGLEASFLELQLAIKVVEEGVDRVVAQASVGDEGGHAGVAAIEVFFAVFKFRDIEQVRRHNCAEGGEGIEFLLFARINAQDKNQNDGAEAAANAVEKRQAEDLSGAAANHRSGHDFAGLMSAPRVALASSQKSAGPAGSPLIGKRIVLIGMRGGSCLVAILKNRMRSSCPTSPS